MFSFIFLIYRSLTVIGGIGKPPGVGHHDVSCEYKSKDREPSNRRLTRVRLQHLLQKSAKKRAQKVKGGIRQRQNLTRGRRAKQKLQSCTVERKSVRIWVLIRGGSSVRYRSSSATSQQYTSWYEAWLLTGDPLTTDLIVARKRILRHGRMK